MKLGTKLAGILIGLLLIPTALCAQEQAKAADESKTAQLRVDFLLTEYNGETKISSLPYSVLVAVSTKEQHQSGSSLRFGVKVPIVTAMQPTAQGTQVPTQVEYQDVGTDVDCRANAEAEGQYGLDVQVSRTSVYSAGEGGKIDEGMHAESGMPILRGFNAKFEVSLRDGQSIEGLTAADPVNGHILKVNVTIHVVK